MSRQSNTAILVAISFISGVLMLSEPRAAAAGVREGVWGMEQPTHIRRILAAESRNESTAAANDTLNDAQLVYTVGGGCAPGGQLASVVNKLTGNAIRVTLQTVTTTSGTSGTGNQTVYLVAGGEWSVGCTIEGSGPPYIYHNFKIIGVQVM